MKWLTRIKCKLNMHPKLMVIQTFGSAQHVGCPYCKKEYGIHHGMRAVIPWTPDLAELYQWMGYDTEGPSRRFRQYVP